MVSEARVVSEAERQVSEADLDSFRSVVSEAERVSEAQFPKQREFPKRSFSSRESFRSMVFEAVLHPK